MLAAVTAALGGGRFRFLAPPPSPLSAPALLAVLNDPRSARVIGRAYLRTLPAAERTAGHLVRAISADNTRGPRCPTSNLPRLINDSVRHDFAAGAVVAVDGWVLSRTEARLYALAALA
jgi:hypothetical protein